ncbi:hypothetical protein [Saccharopolyspora spinosa]|uniref:hypothetical protein n=1 Tax=Saccharopolyspora spinosa TaxID=60894 RepID=UPI0002DDEF50|nr:hypothetical protein [Saccharopolyspora spinosa]
MIAYLEGKRATCQPKTVSAIATCLKHFGVFLADIDPNWAPPPSWIAASTSSPT